MSDYNKKDLRGTLNQIYDLAHKAKMELREIENENEKILKKFEEKKKKYSEGILTGVSHLEGRTIKRVVHIYTGWGNFENHLYFECEDGQRVYVAGRDSESIRLPVFDLNKMIESGIFTDEEIERRKRYIEGEKKRREEDNRRMKERELERLQQELGK